MIINNDRQKGSQQPKMPPQVLNYIVNKMAQEGTLKFPNIKKEDTISCQEKK